MSEVVRDLSSRLDKVHAGLSGMDDTGLMQLLRDMECVSRQTMSVTLDVVAEIEAGGIAAREGFGTTRRLVGAVLHLSAAEARAQAEQARLLGARRSVVADLLQPQLPATAAALTEGRIGAGQVRVITETMALLPPSVPAPTRAKVEADLPGYAADFDPRRLHTLAGRMLAHLDPDGPEPAEAPTATMPARGELLPDLPPTPPNPPPRLGPAPRRQPHRTPTTRDHRPAAETPHQPPPALSVATHAVGIAPPMDADHALARAWFPTRAARGMTGARRYSRTGTSRPLVSAAWLNTCM